MTLPSSKVRRGAVALLSGASVLWAVPALAQRYPPGAVVQPLPDQGRGAELRGHLRTLAENPHSLSALVGAGRAAVALGDYQAALTFFTRARAVSPNDARVLAGLGSVLIHMEQPQDALGYFTQARAAGAPEAEIAGDRGLAYDSVGDQGRAQADYNLSLGGREDPEVRRRLALSLAISGQRDAALRTIADQLARQDRAALRVRTFILALTGDAAAANQSAQQAMPPGAASALAPFLQRLPALSPAQRAMAVHFGRFPTGQQLQIAAAPPPPPPPVSSPPVTTVRREEGRTPAQAAPRPVPPPVSTARQPAAERREERRYRPPGERVTGAPRPIVAQRSLAEQTRRRQSESARREPQPQVRTVETQPQAPVQVAEARPRPQATLPAPPPAPVERPPITEQPQPTQLDRPVTIAGTPTEPEQRSLEIAEPVPSIQQRPGFDQVAALVSSLPPETQRPSSPAAPEPRREPVQPEPGTERPAAAPARERTASAASAQRTPPRQPARPAHPSRHWVQIAGGADRSALPATFTRLREQAPALLRGRTAYVMPLRATNRLLVGPFPTAEAAQAFVNQLAREDITAFAWTSQEGQEVERLSAR